MDWSIVWKVSLDVRKDALTKETLPVGQNLLVMPSPFSGTMNRE